MSATSQSNITTEDRDYAKSKGFAESNGSIVDYWVGSTLLGIECHVYPGKNSWTYAIFRGKSRFPVIAYTEKTFRGAIDSAMAYRN